jgi:hypothetical protein
MLAVTLMDYLFYGGFNFSQPSMCLAWAVLLCTYPEADGRCESAPVLDHRPGKRGLLIIAVQLDDTAPIQQALRRQMVRLFNKSSPWSSLMCICVLVCCVCVRQEGITSACMFQGRRESCIIVYSEYVSS